MRRAGSFGAVAAAALLLSAIAAQRAQAHKPITSKYTYNDDVLPIFRERCGSCHVTGGAGPMSLLNYREAIPWAESIREELVSERMPPWYVDPAGPSVRGEHPITAREIDTIITWATGGTPEGSVAKRPGPSAAPAGWRGGTPDLVLPLERAYTLAADVQEGTQEFSMSTGLREPRWVRAADLLPGTATMVRRATISVEGGPVLAVWLPGLQGEVPLSAPNGSAFRVPAGATLKVSVYYKKPWQEERNALTDRSAVGLYFTDSPAREIESQSSDRPIATTISALAIRPEIDRPYEAIAIDAALADGRRIPMLRLAHPQPEWPRRYWLATSVQLPAGSRIVTSATPLVDRNEATEVASPPRVWLDFVTMTRP
jgi:hypothetical protein